MPNVSGKVGGSMNAISKEKVEALAKRGHVKCHGRGILGFRPKTNNVVFCTCVFRNLRRKGVDIYDLAALQEALAPELPTGTGEVPCPLPT